uniref:Peptidase_M13 domain-containing protein n=1 Tax=Parastrongyloides trichosuri TaxID=131310 RepID=A0A0N4ZHN6_PARTI
MNEETILLIKEKDWLDEETKEMFLEKLKTLKFNFIIHKDIANNEYFNYCIDAIPFDSSKLPHEVLEDITNYFKNDSYYPDNGKISCSEIIEFAIFNKHKNGVYISKYNLLTITLPLIMDPYFNKQFPIPLNYGLLAETIGHEILHAFDTSHRIFDQYGNLRSITTEKSDEEFQIRERCLIDQYSNQTIEGTDENVNGVRTLNENLGDNGGVKLAYRTYLKYVKRLNYNMKPLKGKKELSPDQLFFVSGGRFWCSKKSKQSSSKGVDENVHAPAKNRFNTYISNFKPFSEAFNCKIGTPMNPKNKCEVWRHK